MRNIYFYLDAWQSGFFCLHLKISETVNLTKLDLKLKSEYSSMLDPFDKWKILNQNINWRMHHAVIRSIKLIKKINDDIIDTRFTEDGVYLP